MTRAWSVPGASNVTNRKAHLMTFVRASDQGTRSRRAILFGTDRNPVSTAEKEIPQQFPTSGRVDHDPEDPRSTVAETCCAAFDWPRVLETKSRGVARLGDILAGACPDQASFTETWAPDRRFAPAMDLARREVRCAGWQRAFAATISD